jgi:4-amino-4-deoxy-L-arabinose transferase-like glycosyltransferase
MDSSDGQESLWPDRSGWALIGALSLLFCWNLGRVELSVTDECRSGVIVRDMVEGGHWLLPRTPDGLWTEKPIAYYSLAAAFGMIFGVNEWTLRIVSVLMGMATLVLTWVLARLYGSPRAARIAVVALAANILFVGSARDAMVDTTLAFFLTAGLTAHFAARLGRLPALRGAILAGIAFGLAILTKGPIGLALPIAVAGGDALLEHRGRFWRAAIWWKEGLLTFAIALALSCAWYLSGYLRDGMAFLNNSLLDESLWMPLGVVKRQAVAHTKPLPYYFGIQLVAVLPLLPLLPPLVGWMKDRASDPARRHLTAWLGFGLLFFLIPSNKRMYYLIPLQPAAAAMIALAADRMLRASDGRAVSLVSRVVAGLAGLAGLAAAALAFRPSLLVSLRGGTVAEAVFQQSRWMIVLAAVLVAAGWRLFRAARAGSSANLGEACVFALLVPLVRFGVGDRLEAEFAHTRPFIAEVASKVPAGKKPVILPPIRGYSLDFYWPVRIVRDKNAALKSDYVLVARPQLGEIAGPYETLGTWKYGRDGGDDVLLIRREQAR